MVSLAGREQGRLVDLGAPFGAEPAARREQLPKTHGRASEIAIAESPDPLWRLHQQPRQVARVIGEFDAAQAAVEQRPQEGLEVADVVESDPLAGNGARNPREECDQQAVRVERLARRDRLFGA